MDLKDIRIRISNVVACFHVKCELNLRQIGLRSLDVEYKRDVGMLIMQLRKPRTTAKIWNSGHITCVGATSEEDAKKACRRYARRLQNLGFDVHFHKFRVVNVLAACSMPFHIKMEPFAQKYKHAVEFEPELHPGLTYKCKNNNAVLKIYYTGNMTITAASALKVKLAAEEVYTLLYEFRKELNRDRDIWKLLDIDDILQSETEPELDEEAFDPNSNVVHVQTH